MFSGRFQTVVGVKICGEVQSARFGGPASHLGPGWELQEAVQFLIFQPFDDLADVLRAFARAEQEGVVGLDDYEVMNADGGDKLFGTPEKIPLRIKRQVWAGRDIGAGLRCK